jgi:hypothetical protein
MDLHTKNTRTKTYTQNLVYVKKIFEQKNNSKENLKKNLNIEGILKCINYQNKNIKDKRLYFLFTLQIKGRKNTFSLVRT